MPHPLLCAALLLLAAGCDRSAPPAPVTDRNIERGTALPPPAIALGPGR